MATRKQRGLSERIFLLNASVDNNEEWNLSIKGSSKRIYNIKLSSCETKCKCMDFTIRHKVCKHLYFVICRIINNSDLSKKIKVVEDITNNYFAISNLLKNALNNHISDSKDKIKYNIKDTCCICFEEFGSEDVIQCNSVCKNVFHSDCLKLWLSQNNSCPLCRSDWVNEGNNPLEEFNSLNII